MVMWEQGKFLLYISFVQVCSFELETLHGPADSHDTGLSSEVSRVSPDSIKQTYLLFFQII